MSVLEIWTDHWLRNHENVQSLWLTQSAYQASDRLSEAERVISSACGVAKTENGSGLVPSRVWISLQKIKTMWSYGCGARGLSQIFC